MIHMHIGGHPPFPTRSKQFSGNFGNLLFLVVFNFWGHFEGLNEGFLGLRFSLSPQKWIFLMTTFQWAIMRPKRRSYAKVTPLGSLYTKLPKTRSTKLLDFHLPGLGFWIFFMIKMTLEPHCKIIFLRMWVFITSLLRDKMPIL